MKTLTKKVRNRILVLSLAGILCGLGINKHYSNKKEALVYDLSGDIEIQKLYAQELAKKTTSSTNHYVQISDGLGKKLQTLENYSFYQDCGGDLSYLSLVGFLFALSKKRTKQVI